MTTHLQIISELENELLKTTEVSENLSEQIEFAIGHCKVALDQMRKLVIKEGFPDKASEIHFFKEVKPLVYSKLLYYQAVFDLESTRQKVDKKNLRKYFHQELKKILKFMKKNRIRVQYYRCGHTHLDEKYFTRINKEIPLELQDCHSLMDEDFFTWHDHTFSVIRTNEMLIEYITKEIEKIDIPEGSRQIQSKSPLNWTDNKIDLYEIIYAFYYAGSVNHGKVTISDLADAFEKMFNIELKKDIYHSPKEMIQRADPAKFLSRLVEIIRRKMGDKLG
jgi:hypothetical protein